MIKQKILSEKGKNNEKTKKPKVLFKAKESPILILMRNWAVYKNKSNNKLIMTQNKMHQQNPRCHPNSEVNKSKKMIKMKLKMIPLKINKSVQISIIACKMTKNQNKTNLSNN